MTRRAPDAESANNRKPSTMNNNPFKPIPQRPERWDETWQRRRDPIGFRAIEKVSRRGY